MLQCVPACLPKPVRDGVPIRVVVSDRSDEVAMFSDCALIIIDIMIGCKQCSPRGRGIRVSSQEARRRHIHYAMVAVTVTFFAELQGPLGRMQNVGFFLFQILHRRIYCMSLKRC